MADEPNDFAVLMEQVAQGNQQAAVKMFERYHKPLMTVIRYRLKRFPQLRKLYDSTDFLQMVWLDALKDPEKLHNFASFEAFIKFLAEVARHKVDKAWRYQTAQKRDLLRTDHLSDPGVAGTAARAADSRPDAAQQAETGDQLVPWIRSLTKRHRFVCLRLAVGYSYREIASDMGCSVRTIKRIVAELRSDPPPRPVPYL